MSATLPNGDDRDANKTEEDGNGVGNTKNTDEVDAKQSDLQIDSSGMGVRTSQVIQKSSQNLREKAIRFLNHPSIRNIPSVTKDSYLRSKGMSDQDIAEVKAMKISDITDMDNIDSIWQHVGEKGTGVENNSQNRFPYQTNDALHMNSDGGMNPTTTGPHFHTPQDLPNPMVPVSTLRAVLSIFGLAASRWLNGGDFILFPSPVQTDIDADDKSNALLDD